MGWEVPALRSISISGFALNILSRGPRSTIPFSEAQQFEALAKIFAEDADVVRGKSRKGRASTRAGEVAIYAEAVLAPAPPAHACTASPVILESATIALRSARQPRSVIPLLRFQLLSKPHFRRFLATSLPCLIGPRHHSLRARKFATRPSEANP